MANSAPSDPSTTCDSCGAPADDLATVQRIYLISVAGDTDEQVEVADDIERWCVPCRTSYPHQPVGS